MLLRDLGCEVDVFERAGEALEDRGAGIVVLPITERVFTDRESTQERVSLELTYWSYMDRTGEIVSADPQHLRFAGWSTIYRALLAEYGRARYHFDHEVVSFSQDEEGVAVRFADGQQADGDLLVFADGFNSTGRRLLLPDVGAEYSGYVAWRGTTPETALSPGARAHVSDAMIYQVLDPGHILVYAIPDAEGRVDPPHREINYVWYRNAPMSGLFEDLMTDRNGVVRSGTMPPGLVRPGHLTEMRETADRVLAPALREIVLGCPQPLIQAVFDVFSPKMAFDRVCLLGDAAATVRPHIAAGQAKACADAWALRDALEQSSGAIASALTAWEHSQLEVARSALERSRSMGVASQFDGTMVAGDPNWRFGLWEPGN